MAVTQQLDSLALQMRSALPGQEQYTVNSHSPISAAADAMQAYSELYNKVLDFASLLRTKLSNDARNVAILSTTGADFLFCWLGLLQLGCRVMLIAPEVTTTGIANLLWETGSKVLFHDSKLSHLAHNAIAILAETKRSTCVSHLLPETCDISSYSHPTPIYDMSASDTAYVHHTSGTSTGLPKPISVTHQGAVGALPVLENSGATFTTTPLYHGGPADCFRAWTSGALIWLFPGIGDVPITARNVIEAFLAAKDNAHRSTISYFTAVPYILELLSSSEDGTEILRELQLVGVGGAALSNKVGDKLAKQDGVRLISRYGSAECGFVMSSRRDYDSDTDWQYLYEHDHPGLKFEQQEDGASELILSNMPFMAKYNRGQGVYATSDCFRQHTEKPKRWVYQSRNDSQLSLSTGKKFDPASLETSITELIQRFRTIREVYVFGNGRPYAGILLFRSKGSGLNDAEISDQIWPAIQTANKFSPPHAQIRRQMLVVMPHDSPKLQRSSKGTVMRRQVEETYDNAIQNAYRCQTTVAGRHKSLDVNQLTWNVRRIVRDKLPTNVPASVPDHEDLYKVGADSIVCLEIRDQLQQDYGHSIGSDLSPTVVYDCGSIKGLTEYIYSLHTGDGVTKEEGRSGMEAMVERFRHVYPSDDYGDISTVTMNGSATNRVVHKPLQEIILLTGATGTLGIHVFNQLRASDKVAEIHCLIRGVNQHAAEQRLRKALSQKSLPPLEQPKPHIAIHPCKLAEKETLGLKPETYDKLRKTTTFIIHAAWLVNFNLPLNGFEDQLLSLTNLLNLSTSSTQPIPPSFLFCSSTAAVLGVRADQTIQETVYADPKAATKTGYAKSKWVAERICQEIYQSRHLPMAVARIGQLCGDDETGAWNVTEAWPLMLSSTKATNALPRLQGEKLDWLKVDVAATAIVEIGFDLLSNARQSHRQLDAPLPVYHVVNGHRTPTWDDMLGWIKGWNRDLEILPPPEWVDRLENLTGNGRDHPARKLLGLWKAAYCGSGTSRKSRDDNAFAMARTLEVAPVLREVKPIDEVHFAKVWQWVQQEM